MLMTAHSEEPEIPQGYEDVEYQTMNGYEDLEYQGEQP